MLDLILISFCGGVFAGGFWCGAKFGSFKAMASAAKARVRAWL